MSERGLDIDTVRAAVIACPSLLPSPVLAETQSAKGTVTTYSVVLTPGEPCETVEEGYCPVGRPCLNWIDIEGDAARALYDAIKTHKPKFNDAAGNSYFGTSTDAMTCWLLEGRYSCQIGYDAIQNVLAESKGCQFE